MKTSKLTMLVIMDGLGYPTDLSRSAVLQENTTNLRRLADKYPSTLLNASELEVGLPDGQAGTSDVGHLTIGTGRVIYQPLVRINKEIESGKFFENPALVGAMENAKEKGKSLHLMGIPTDGGVHGHIEHLLALLRMAKQYNVKNVFLHIFTDGRDTPPKSAHIFIKRIEEEIKKLKVGEIATVIGRFYALDRDNNWDRVEVAYDAMVRGEGFTANSAIEAINMAYEREETDEFIMPTVILNKNNQKSLIKNGDSVISYNYRADRERQLAYVFYDDNTIEYTDKNLKTHFVCMTEYDENLTKSIVAYPTDKQTNILSEVLSNRGYKQLKVAETEKYAYITFAFNDGRQEAFPNEIRSLVSSEKMKTYISKPEMSAYQVAEKTIEGIKSGKYDVIIVNFANCDMVGHSGDLEATKQAVAVVDECVGNLIKELQAVNGRAIVTADHGNADIMKYQDGSPHTAHTTSKVPCIIVDDEIINLSLRKGGDLTDIAPTLLHLLNEEVPAEMTGKSLLIT